MANRHWKTTEDRSHKERVAMRQLLRDSGTIPPDAPNTKADQWLMTHGYLTHKGYKPPEDRVQKLQQRLGRRRKRK